MKRKLKPNKLNKHLVIEKIGKKRGIKFSIIFTDFGHRCAYIKPNNNNLIWLLYTLRRNCYKKYFEFMDKCDYDMDLFPSVHGGIGFIYFRRNRDRGFTDGLVFGWDYGHINDAKDLDLVKKYFGEEQFKMVEMIVFKGVPVREYSLEEINEDIKITIDNILYIDRKHINLKKELQRMVTKPFVKKRKYKNK